MGQTLFILCNTFALLGAWSLSRVLLPAASAVERALATVAGAPLLVVPTLTALGIGGGLRPWAVCAALFIEALAGLTLAWRRGRMVGVFAAAAVPQASRSLRDAAFVSLTWSLAAVLAWHVIGRLLVSGWNPHWDDLSYHAPMPSHWVQSGRLTLAPYNYHAYYPGNGELLAAFFMLPTRLDAYASLTGVYYLGVCALALAALCRQVGADAAVSGLAVATFFAIRPFYQHATSFAAVDLGCAAFAAAGVAFSASVSRDEPAVTALARAGYAGGLFGLAIGAKITHAPVAVLALLWMVLERRASAARALQMAGVFATTALACGGYFYLRNALLTGNPFFPAQILWFEGPLDAEALRPTSLLFQLRQLSGPKLMVAVKQLVQWPAPIAYVLLGGYALALVSLVRPRSWREPSGRAVALLALAGLLGLAVTVSGPFSGTANAEWAKLQIRLRFFLPFMLLAVAVTAYLVGRSGVLKPWLVLAGVLPVALAGGLSPAEILAAAALALLGFAAARALSGKLDAQLSRARAPALLSSFVLVPALASQLMVDKQPENDRLLDRAAPAYRVLDRVPEGARVTWFVTFEGYKYYPVFGPRLSRIPVAVEPDGRPQRFLHEYWRQYQPTWWGAKSRPREMSRLVENLAAQRIEYVLVIKRHKGKWPSQYALLDKSKRVKALVKKKSHALFQIARSTR